MSYSNFPSRERKQNLKRNNSNQQILLAICYWQFQQNRRIEEGYTHVPPKCWYRHELLLKWPDREKIRSTKDSKTREKWLCKITWPWRSSCLRWPSPPPCTSHCPCHTCPPRPGWVWSAACWRLRGLPSFPSLPFLVHSQKEHWLPAVYLTNRTVFTIPSCLSTQVCASSV